MRKLWRPRDCAIEVAAFVPSAALAIWFFWTHGSISRVIGSVPARHRWNALWRASTVVFSYDQVGVAISTAFGLTLFGLVLLCRIQLQWNFWTSMALIFMALYFISPPHAGIGQYVLEGLNVNVLLSFALWIATVPHRPIASVLMVIVSVGVSLGLVARYAPCRRIHRRRTRSVES